MILVVAKPKRHATDLSDMLNFMGVLSTPVTPAEAFCEISAIYRSIIVLTPEKIYDEEDFTEKLRTYARCVPIFAKGDAKFPSAFDAIIDESASAAKILDFVRSFCEGNNLPLPADYRIAGLDVSQNLKTATYFSRAVSLTKTELMILRALIRLYPNPTKPSQIIPYAFRSTRAPEEASVRTHISIINKKFEKLSGRKLIHNKDKEGYVILTPELSTIGAT